MRVVPGQQNNDTSSDFDYVLARIISLIISTMFFNYAIFGSKNDWYKFYHEIPSHLVCTAEFLTVDSTKTQIFAQAIREYNNLQNVALFIYYTIVVFSLFAEVFIYFSL